MRELLLISSNNNKQHMANRPSREKMVIVSPTQTMTNQERPEVMRKIQCNLTRFLF